MKFLFQILFYLCFVIYHVFGTLESATLPLSPYSDTAHKHWVWLHAKESTQESNEDLIADYASHNIRVGGLDLDSGWSTYYNNFEVDEEKFPDFETMIGSFSERGIWTIMWATSMINEDDPNYQTAIDNNYFIKTPRGTVRPIKWWHGTGALVDFSNDEAREWFNSMMDDILDAGVMGFKCDGTDPYILEYIQPQTSEGDPITYREYADQYYSDFKDYTFKKNGDSLIWSRPVDCATQTDVICGNYSPHDLMFSGWVGDDDSSWQGLRSCLRKNIYSSWRGYNAFGCDIGGYRADSSINELGRDPETFLRWVQTGTFMSLMENGGGGEHRPWKFDEYLNSSSNPTQYTDIYRTFTNIHYSLASYLHSAGTVAHYEGGSVFTPISQLYNEEEPYKYPLPETLAYYLGKDIFVQPIATDSHGFVNIEWPEEGVKWRDFWAPAFVGGEGGKSKTIKYPLGHYPAFIRQGAVLPLRVYNEDDILDHSYEHQFTIYLPEVGERSIDVYSQEFHGMTFTYSLSEDGHLSFSLTPFSPPEESDLQSSFSVKVLGVVADPENVEVSSPSISHFSKVKREFTINVHSGKRGVEGEMDVEINY